MSRAQKTMLAVAIIAVILISAWLFVAVPELEKMPADYHSQVEFDGELRWLEPGVEELGAPFPFKDAMTHQVLTRSGDVLIIQSNVIAKDPATGKIFWEAKERMGVDRATRQHVAGFGDMDRQGYFTFPLHVQKRDYEFWYPGILAKGPCVFEREEALQDLDTYVFTFRIEHIPSSELYPQYEPEQIYSDQQGAFWVEPVSGQVVRYDLAWDFYFVEDGQKGQSVDVGSKTFTQATIASQVQIARSRRLLIRLYELGIPASLAVVAVALLVAVSVTILYKAIVTLPWPAWWPVLASRPGGQGGQA